MSAESLTRQILRAHLVDGELEPGSAIGLRADQTLLQDATGTMAFMQFEQLGVGSVQVAFAGLMLVIAWQMVRERPREARRAPPRRP